MADHDFTSLLKSRRSANKFIPGVEMDNKELDEMFNLVKYAPSAFNLQHAHYVVVKDPDLKEKVYEAAEKQYKVRTASAVILVLGKLDAHKDAAAMNEGLLNLGVLSKQEYDQLVSSTIGFYESRGEQFMRDEAIRSASLSAMQFMLIAKDKGWDTCPMIGFNPDEMRKLLQVPDNYVPAMLIAIGKEDTSSFRPRGYRKPVGEFVSYDKF
ncbi:nitroreductase [Paenibacillus macerans]|uniref:nitroreductase family protein n=1 Tax=Paenibacillus macerans TaxID=44252 RepID=UPI00208AA058|nr:nitroreductase family protein [Paenibacillus macerans]MBS5911439.1 nitroreductase family protein [Paenibacillus macerans]GJM71674.1 nitroreductase [Paenibacillus macerans]